MSQLILLTGTNKGNRLANLQKAKLFVEEKIGTVIQQSSIYQTAAWGNTEQEDFLNQVLIIETNETPFSILEILLKIEIEMGRVRSQKWEARIIDIDILFFGNEIVEKENLQIPHPYLHLRRFTLIPLNDLIPDFIHPVLKKTITELLNECNDNLEVKAYK